MDCFVITVDSLSGYNNGMTGCYNNELTAWCLVITVDWLAGVWL